MCIRDRRLTDKIPNYLENPSALQKISRDGKSITNIDKILDSLNVEKTKNE